MFYKKISDSFARWGKKEQKLPANNDTLKQNILNAVRPTMTETTKSKFRFRWVFMTLVPALAILLMIQYNKTPTAYESSTSYLEKSSLSDTGDLGSMGMTASNLGLKQEENSFLEKVVDKISMPRTEPMMIAPPDYYNESKDITDTREYLKTNFSLRISTRKVEKNYTRIKTIIRGHGGRIDDSKLTQKYASLNFVVPKSSYDDFAEEVKSLFPEKFITLSENTTNLLGQKQNIEEQTESTSALLEDLEQHHESLVKTHTEKVASLEKEINRLNGIVYSFIQQRKNIPVTNTVEIQKINDQINYYTRLHKTQNQLLNEENNFYYNSIFQLDQQITAEENRLTELNNQNTNLLNNVETVDGTITIQWVNLFEIVNLYIPVYKTIIIVCILIIIGYFLFGRKQKEIELP